MKSDIKSYSTRSSVGSTSKQFLLPSGSQLMLYILVSISLLAVLNVKNAWDYLNSTILAPQGGLNDVLAKNSPWLSRTLNSLSHSMILQVIFWIAVGCVVYVIIWFMRNVTINIFNDIAGDSYVHPASYKRLEFWGSVLMRKVFSGISIVLLIFYVGASTRMLIDLSQLCYRLLQHFQPIQSLLEIAGCILVTTGLIYVLILLVHITVTTWRLIYRDL